MSQLLMIKLYTSRFKNEILLLHVLDSASNYDILYFKFLEGI